VPERAVAMNLGAGQFRVSKVGAGVSSPSPPLPGANMGYEGGSQMADASRWAGKTGVSGACPPLLSTPPCSPQIQTLPRLVDSEGHCLISQALGLTKNTMTTL